MKMKKFWAGGGAHPSGPPLRSATDADVWVRVFVLMWLCNRECENTSINNSYFSTNNFRLTNEGQRKSIWCATGATLVVSFSIIEVFGIRDCPEFCQIWHSQITWQKFLVAKSSKRYVMFRTKKPFCSSKMKPLFPPLCLHLFIRTKYVSNVTISYKWSLMADTWAKVLWKKSLLC